MFCISVKCSYNLCPLLQYYIHTQLTCMYCNNSAVFTFSCAFLQYYVFNGMVITVEMYILCELHSFQLLLLKYFRILIACTDIVAVRFLFVQC